MKLLTGTVVYYHCHHCNHVSMTIPCEFCESNDLGMMTTDTKLVVNKENFGLGRLGRYEEPSVCEQINYNIAYRLSMGFALICRGGDGDNDYRYTW